MFDGHWWSQPFIFGPSVNDGGAIAFELLFDGHWWSQPLLFGPFVNDGDAIAFELLRSALHMRESVHATYTNTSPGYY